MAVEDHPKWKQWSDAYDALGVAASNLQDHRTLPPSAPVRQAALARYRDALAAYNKISAEIE